MGFPWQWLQTALPSALSLRAVLRQPAEFAQAICYSETSLSPNYTPLELFTMIYRSNDGAPHSLQRRDCAVVTWELAIQYLGSDWRPGNWGSILDWDIFLFSAASRQVHGSVDLVNCCWRSPAQSFILGSESHGTHNHILQSPDSRIFLIKRLGRLVPR
jgi:hypothetical protein